MRSLRSVPGLHLKQVCGYFTVPAWSCLPLLKPIVFFTLSDGRKKPQLQLVFPPQHQSQHWSAPYLQGKTCKKEKALCFLFAAGCWTIDSGFYPQLSGKSTARWPHCWCQTRPNMEVCKENCSFVPILFSLQTRCSCCPFTEPLPLTSRGQH